MALVSKNFADLITFTRASGGGRFNAYGKYEWLAANVPRIDYDPVTGQCRGLLIEEQRTNLLTYSNDLTKWSTFGSTPATITASAALGLDGTMSADKLTASNVDSGAILTVAVTAGTTYTFSIWMRADSPVNLRWGITGGTAVSADITVTTQWQRYSITRTIEAGVTYVNLQIGGWGRFISEAVYVWEQQLEVGPSATSNIPTTSAQVTRAADVPSVNTLSPWINASSFTLIVSAIVPLGTPTGRLVTLEGSGITTDSSFVNSSASSVGSEVYAGGVPKGTISIPRSSDYFTVGLSQDINGRSLSVNGSNVVMGAGPSAVPPFMLMRIGGVGWGSNPSINGHIRSIRYYPKRLTNAELQELTA